MRNFASMSGALAKRAVIRGTLGLCARLGRLLREARRAHADPVVAIKAVLRPPGWPLGRTGRVCH